MMVRIPPLLAATQPDECAALLARQLQARIRYRRRFAFHADQKQERLPNRRGKNRRALLAYVDALREAAGKVTCHKCEGTGRIFPRADPTGNPPCPDCAALRAMLTPPAKPE